MAPPQTSQVAFSRNRVWASGGFKIPGDSGAVVVGRGWSVAPLWHSSHHPLHQRSPTFLATGTSFVEDNFSADWGCGADGLGMIQAHYIYCVLYFYYYYIVTYNKIIIQLTITQNQWEPWTCFPATRWSHLGMMADSDTRSVLLTSSLLHKMQLNCYLPLTDRVLIWVCKQLITVSVQSNLSANDNLYL